MMRTVVYFLGRTLQLVGMWLLIVDTVMAGPMGPELRPFAIGVGVFLAGWGLTKVYRPAA